jgi:uncharacterized protein YjiK
MMYLQKSLLIVMLLFAVVAILALNVPWDESPAGYILEEPDRVDELPDILEEVSGLTVIDGQTIACVQDEDGTVFIYDLEKGQIIRQIDFAGPGDYEGISRVEDDLFVLRSDGTLFELTDFRGKVPHVTTHHTELPIKESEGLGLDRANDRLLIAAKSKARDDAYRGKKVVYGFDLEQKRRTPEPVLQFSEGDGGINPSAIAVHPLTGQLYVLSSKDHLLYVFRGNDAVEGIYRLPKGQFAQPEGLTFLPDGDMLISNEGKDEPANLLRFNYTPAP